ncbi:threonine aldolase [Harryflintia acetispora]|nr:threonine aldolase [Harryflintia acetispora]
MISFKNDYSEGAHPRILEALTRHNFEQSDGYGCDEGCARARALILDAVRDRSCDVHFLVGGTQANLCLIAHALRPHEAAVSAGGGHINVHETGAIEATGHKVLTRPAADGKLTPALVREVLEEHTDEHMVRPGLVYVSHPTEVGTLYTKQELEALSSFCRERGLPLYLDGARLSSALAAPGNDLELPDICRLTDTFYLGGTKCGALFGEALIIRDETLKRDFRFIQKQRGALLAKGFLLGIQFEELLRDGLYYELGAHANAMAEQLRGGIRGMGYSFAPETRTNQLFPRLPDGVVEALSQDYAFELWAKGGDKQSVIRLVTSWATKEENVARFLEDLQRLSR